MALFLVSEGVSRISLGFIVGALAVGLLYVVYLEIVARQQER